MDLGALMAAAGERSPMPFHEVRTPNPRVIAHIDGDYMAYFAAGNDNCDAGDARRNVLARVSRLLSISGAGKAVMHLTHDTSTKGERFLAATTQPYQGQRKQGRKPKNWEFLRHYLETYEGPAFTPKVWMTREADDGIAYVCDSVARHHKLLHVVHSADKDMRMFCGVHVSWDDFYITEVPLDSYDVQGRDGKQYGHKWFWIQLLTGDSADHIPGLPGVGPATAEQLLVGTDSNASAAPIVFGEYARVRGEDWRDYFAEQAVLLWMRTDRDADLLNVLGLPELQGERMREAFDRLAERVGSARRRLESLNE